MKFCPNCRKELIEGMKFCGECGANLTQILQPPLPKPIDKGVEWEQELISPVPPPLQQPQYQHLHTPPAQQPHKSKAVIIMGIALIIIAIIVIAGLATIFIKPTANRNDEIDIILPTIVSTEPANGAIDVSPQLTITITFSEPMYQSTTIHKTLYCEPHDITRTYASTEWINNKTVRITNLMGFKFDTIHIITIRNPGLYDIKDEAGNYLEHGYNWSFTTRPANIDILSSTIYHKSEDDYTHVYGEIKNQDNFNLDYVELNVICFDINHDIIKTESIYAKPNSLWRSSYGLIIKPNEIAPFALSVGDRDGVIKNIDIEIIYARWTYWITNQQEYEGLDVVNHDGSYDMFRGEYTVSGEVKNNGDQQADYVRVLVTFYDSSSRVIGVKDHYTSPKDIGIGQTANFEVTIYDDECDTVNIENYSLIAHD